jgi:hypothetical protein
VIVRFDVLPIYLQIPFEVVDSLEEFVLFKTNQTQFRETLGVDRILLANRVYDVLEINLSFVDYLPLFETDSHIKQDRSLPHRGPQRSELFCCQLVQL